MQKSHVFPLDTVRLLGAGLLALALMGAMAGDAWAQAKKGAPGQNVQPTPQAAPADTGLAPGELPEPRQAMRSFVSDISAYARSVNSAFIVLTMGGLDLLERVDPVDPTKRAPAATYMRTIDGIIAREINFHPPDEHGEIKTDEKIRTERLRLAALGQRRDLKIWSIDYAKDQSMAQESIRASLAKSFIPFPSMDAGYRFDNLPRYQSRPLNENPNTITGINHVKNFLMLTDSSRWDSQEEFAQALANTNYDAIVVDVFHRGRTPLTPRTVEGLRYKKLGTRRLVLAYANIGEAESYRYYWKPNWREGSPSFISAPTPDNPDKYSVQYWDAGWRDLMTGNANSYIYGILAQGFDGVVLDGVDGYRAFEGPQ